jgi:hypothetical protein
VALIDKLEGQIVTSTMTARGSSRKRIKIFEEGALERAYACFGCDKNADARRGQKATLIRIGLKKRNTLV